MDILVKHPITHKEITVGVLKNKSILTIGSFRYLIDDEDPQEIKIIKLRTYDIVATGVKATDKKYQFGSHSDRDIYKAAAKFLLEFQ